MPFVSNSQRRKFGELVAQGKMSQVTFDEWNSATPANLPERVGKQTSPKSFAEIREIKKTKGIK